MGHDPHFNEILVSDVQRIKDFSCFGDMMFNVYQNINLEDEILW